MELSHFAIIFPNQHKALEAQVILKKLHRNRHINLKQAAVLVKHPDGQIAAQLNNPGLNLFNPRYGLAGLAGSMVGLIGAAPLGPGALVAGFVMGGAGTSAALGYDLMQKLGIPGPLRYEIEAKMPPASSAIVIQAEILSTKITLRELGRLGGGELIQHHLTQPMYQQLRQLSNPTTGA